MVRREDKAMRSGVGRCIMRDIFRDDIGHRVKVE